MRLTKNIGEDLSVTPEIFKRRGRPKGEPKKHVSVYVLPATAETLQAQAFKKSVSLGEIIDRLLSPFKSKNKKQNEKEHIPASKTLPSSNSPVNRSPLSTDKG